MLKGKNIYSKKLFASKFSIQTNTIKPANVFVLFTYLIERGLQLEWMRVGMFVGGEQDDLDKDRYTCE